MFRASPAGWRALCWGFSLSILVLLSFLAGHRRPPRVDVPERSRPWATWEEMRASAAAGFQVMVFDGNQWLFYCPEQSPDFKLFVPLDEARRRPVQLDRARAEQFAEWGARLPRCRVAAIVDLFSEAQPRIVGWYPRKRGERAYEESLKTRLLAIQRQVDDGLDDQFACPNRAPSAQ